MVISHADVERSCVLSLQGSSAVEASARGEPTKRLTHRWRLGFDIDFRTLRHVCIILTVIAYDPSTDGYIATSIAQA